MLYGMDQIQHTACFVQPTTQEYFLYFKWLQKNQNNNIQCHTKLYKIQITVHK